MKKWRLGEILDAVFYVQSSQTRLAIGLEGWYFYRPRGGCRMESDKPEIAGENYEEEVILI